MKSGIFTDRCVIQVPSAKCNEESYISGKLWHGARALQGAALLPSAFDEFFRDYHL